MDLLEGLMEGEIDWIFKSHDKDAIDWTVGTLWLVGVHIMGSRTYQDMAAYWPSSTEPFAAPMNDIPKVVFSRKGHIESPGVESTTRAFKDAARINLSGNLKPSAEKNALEVQWGNSKVAGGDLTKEINRLIQQSGKDILAHGGARFAQSLVKLGLIDEYRLLIHPVVLGNGLPLFSALSKTMDLKLVDSLKFGAGIIANTYIPA
jgi:dihydrofolate reductase